MMSAAEGPIKGETEFTGRLLSVIVPIYNDADCVRPFLDKVGPLLAAIQKRFSYDREIVFVMDPSTDGTDQVILKAREKDPAIKLIGLSRRFGQQPAILAGLFSCRGECAVIIDVDLQDPPELMVDMMAKYVGEQYDVVYAVRTRRLGEPWVKRALTGMGYYLMNRLSNVRIPRHVGDFRLVNRRVIEEIRRLNERHGFFRGLVSFVGFRQTGIPFERQARMSGRTKYNYFLGSITNGVNALVCYSNKLLTLSSIIGVFFFFLSLLLSLAVVYLKFVTKLPFASGIPSLMILVIFTSGIQALLIGILGSYVGRIYDETKQRPIYIIDKKIGW